MAGKLQRQKTFIQRNVPVAPSICHRYLPLLGFPETDYMDKNLFVQANRDAFHQVMHFLFSILNGKRCAKDFRDCFPITDKKLEALFRQTAFNWYNELAEVPSNGLFAIQASLFLCPGGGKFIEFMNQFVRFVALRHMKNKNADIESPETFKKEPWNLLCQIRAIKGKTGKHMLSDEMNKGDEIAKLLKVLVIENTQCAKKAFTELNQCYEEGKEVINTLTIQYRSLQESMKSGKEREKELTELIENKIKQRNVSTSNTSQKNKAMQPEEQLRSICQDFKREEGELLKELRSILYLIEKNLEMIEHIYEPDSVDKEGNKNRVVLNVTKMIKSVENIDIKGKQDSKANSISDRQLYTIIESFMSQIKADGKFIISEGKKHDLPLKELISTGKLVNAYMIKFQQLYKDMQKQLSETSNIAVELEDELKNIQWENVFNTTSSPAAENNIWMSHGPVVPPIPPIVFDAINNGDTGNKDTIENGGIGFLLSNFGCSYAPINKDAMPNKEDAMPNKKDAMPNKEDAIPNKEDAVSNKDTMPNEEDAMPIKEDAMPNKEDAVSNKDAMPNKEDAMPNKILTYKLDEGNTVMSTSPINKDEMPIEFPTGTIDEFNPVMSSTVKCWKTMSSNEVNDRMTDAINKLDGDAETGIDDVENITLQK